VQGDFRIGRWLIQPQLHTISLGAQVINVEPKAMQVLVCLAGQTQEVVTKERLIREVWTDTFVTDDVLTRCISELRRAFNDDSKDPRVIQTIPRVGYRLIAPVQSAIGEALPGRRRTRGLLVTLAGALALALLLFASNVGGVRRWLWRPGPAPKIQSVVVLPLENLSRDPEQDYFADGMTEELITELTKISALHVISRRSAIYYKGTKKTLPQIAQELGVDGVIEGTVQRSGDRVRVSAQLVEGRTDHHLWADTYDRDLHDVLALEGEVARAIAHEIQLKLTPEENARLVHRRPVSTEAYEAYLKGLYYWNRLSEEDLRKSIDYFQQAIRLAPDFAPAYSGLAFSYTLLASQEFVAPQDAYPKAKELARKALELDQNLADAHAALGFALCYSDWNWREAETEFRRAIELEPNAERGHHVYSLYLNDMGRNEEAIADIKKSLEADPLSVLARWNLGYFYITSGQPERGAEEFRKTLEIDPGPDGHQGLGMAYTLENRLDDAIAELQEAVKLSPGNTSCKASLGYAYAMAGKRIAALKVVDDLKQTSKRKYVSAYLVAMVYAGLSDKAAAFQWLETALRQRDDQLPALKVDPFLAPLRPDARFADLLRRIGLA
jgi:TolB-like protein/DNA-binding winged helix-turn-helix (wHTH) protein/cytochrome c-type biogenesis protein CcmH/NrfG